MLRIPTRQDISLLNSGNGNMDTVIKTRFSDNLFVDVMVGYLIGLSALSPCILFLTLLDFRNVPLVNTRKIDALMT